MRSIPRGPPSARLRRSSRPSLQPQIVHDPAAEEALDVPGTPFVLVMDGRGVVRAKGTVNNLEQVEGLVDSALRRMEEERWAS